MSMADHSCDAVVVGTPPDMSAIDFHRCVADCHCPLRMALDKASLTKEEEEYPDLDAYLREVVSNPDFDWEPVYQLKDHYALNFMDGLQSLIQGEGPASDLGYRWKKKLVKLVRESQQLPRFLYLQGVERVPGDPIAGGGCADIYLGKWRGETIALKAIRVYTNIAEDQKKKIIGEFCREAVHWHHVQHPHVLPFYGICEDVISSRLCMVSPWMVQGNIRDYLAKNPDAHRLKLLYETATAIEYIHTAKPSLIHGDIKPQNILVRDGHACLCDFGMVTISESQQTMGTNSGSGGTLRYYAPERFQSHKTDDERDSAPTRQSDVFAFAMTIYEIFTGTFPFADVRNDITVVLEVIKGVRPQRPRPDKVSAGFSDAVWDLMQDCWAAEPVERPTTSHVCATLRRILFSADIKGTRAPSHPLWSELQTSSSGIQEWKLRVNDLPHDATVEELYVFFNQSPPPAEPPAKAPAVAGVVSVEVYSDFAIICYESAQHLGYAAKQYKSAALRPCEHHKCVLECFLEDDSPSGDEEEIDMDLWNEFNSDDIHVERSIAVDNPLTFSEAVEDLWKSGVDPLIDWSSDIQFQPQDGGASLALNGKPHGSAASLRPTEKSSLPDILPDFQDIFTWNDSPLQFPLMKPTSSDLPDETPTPTSPDAVEVSSSFLDRYYEESQHGDEAEEPSNFPENRSIPIDSNLTASEHGNSKSTDRSPHNGELDLSHPAMIPTSPGLREVVVTTPPPSQNGPAFIDALVRSLSPEDRDKKNDGAITAHDYAFPEHRLQDSPIQGTLKSSKLSKPSPRASAVHPTPVISTSPRTTSPEPVLGLKSATHREDSTRSHQRVASVPLPEEQSAATVDQRSNSTDEDLLIGHKHILDIQSPSQDQLLSWSSGGRNGRANTVIGDEHADRASDTESNFSAPDAKHAHYHSDGEAFARNLLTVKNYKRASHIIDDRDASLASVSTPVLVPTVLPSSPPTTTLRDHDSGHFSGHAVQHLQKQRDPISPWRQHVSLETSRHCAVIVEEDTEGPRLQTPPPRPRDPGPEEQQRAGHTPSPPTFTSNAKQTPIGDRIRPPLVYNGPSIQNEAAAAITRKSFDSKNVRVDASQESMGSGSLSFERRAPSRQSSDSDSASSYVSRYSFDRSVTSTPASSEAYLSASESESYFPHRKNQIGTKYLPASQATQMFKPSPLTTILSEEHSEVQNPESKPVHASPPILKSSSPKQPPVVKVTKPTGKSTLA